uniref:C2H2-type domain-containing protein n=1 Tax=Sinocyclocheilus grahami TaxID=75366 RepID=A0A672L915_SINGR
VSLPQRWMFTTAFNLQSHILSFHEEQRSFICTQPGCGRSFAMKQSLLRHGVVHDPEKKQLKSHPKRSLASRLSARPPRTTDGFDTKPTATDILSTICITTLSCLGEENHEICSVHFQSRTALFIS